LLSFDLFGSVFDVDVCPRGAERAARCQVHGVPRAAENMLVEVLGSG